MARTVEVTPERWLPRGEVLVTERGLRPLLVWGGIVGEPARVRIVHKGGHQVRGEWVSSPVPHARRVAPRCEHYEPCGGCSWMHLDPAGQADARVTLIRQILTEEGVDATVVPVTGADLGVPSAGFRHVVKVGFGVSDTGRPKIGAWGRHSRNVVPIPNCLVAAPILRKTMMSLAHHTLALGIPPYDPQTRRGVLRAAVLRASRTTGEVLVTLVAARREFLLSELAEELGRGVNAVVGTWLHLNDGEGNAIFQRDDQGVVGVVPLAGKEWIEERLDDVVYRIGPGDFFQTNPAVAELLYRRIGDALELATGDAVIDLYSGVGGVALQAARRTGFALGVEEIDGAVQRARESARLNKLPAEFVCGQVLELLPDLVRRFKGAGPKVVVDPARRGLEPGVVDAIVSLEPSAVAYVSCNPVAMARDLRAFTAHGYKIGDIEPFDMFPHTPHVECLVVLTPPNAPAASRRSPKRQLVR
ncbi:MAG: 23S rRNA (uracil(1939)-C(5))-methyltransferase RlmD [Myxococcota bacterium]